MIHLRTYRWYFLKFINALEFDFYCVSIHNNRIINWVIEVDGDHHINQESFYFSSSKHRSDILKQYYLSIMGVHFLRLPIDQINYDTINIFYNKIINSDIFIIENPIIPINSYFDFTTENQTVDKYYGMIYDHDILLRSSIFFDFIEDVNLKCEIDLNSYPPSINPCPVTSCVDMCYTSFSKYIINGSLVGSINYKKIVKNDTSSITLDELLDEMLKRGTISA